MRKNEAEAPAAAVAANSKTPLERAAEFGHDVALDENGEPISYVRTSRDRIITLAGCWRKAEADELCLWLIGCCAGGILAAARQVHLLEGIFAGGKERKGC